MPSVSLKVDNLPKNNLAYSNLVYVSPSTFTALSGLPPPAPGGSPSSAPLTLIGIGSHVYGCASHKDVPDDVLALNGLQRKAGQVTLQQQLSVASYRPDPQSCLATLTVAVDFLAKPKEKVQAKVVNTDDLAKEFQSNFMGQMFMDGQVVALEFDGLKLEITVTAFERINISKDSKVKDDHLGQLLQPTAVMFQKAKGASYITLEGNAVSGGGASNLFTKDFDFAKLGIGGLDAEFNHIFRRAFASRIWPSHIMKQMGINHVRGMLLYGPPGCGKTLIARQIGKALNAREPKIVNGPEILDKFVGGSEEKVRELFADAEKEQKEAGDASMLHIIILDEMDAICKSRGTVRDGTGVSDSVVNQLLSKIDGVDSLNNILLIGMTNRKDMIDDALLRPGRLEVHIEIGLPDEKGRNQILGIHTSKMIAAGRVSADVAPRLPEVAKASKNFSGAEIEGLVRSATSFALARAVDVKDMSKAPKVEDLVVSFQDFERALTEIEPKFGAKSADFGALYRGGIVNYGDDFERLQETMNKLVEQVRQSSKTPLLSVLLEGSPFTGKTAFAAYTAIKSGFPFVRIISADTMIGYSESSKCQEIHKVFMDSWKSPLSFIFIDDIERLIEYVPIGPRFNNAVLQTLLVLMKKMPPDDKRKLLIVGTTSVVHLLEDLGLTQAFSIQQHVPLLEPGGKGIKQVLMESGNCNDKDAEDIAALINKPIGIKQLLMIVEMAMSNSENRTLDLNIFMECLHTVGF